MARCNSRLERGGECGFTLIEIVLTVGLMALLAGLYLPISQTFQGRNELDLAVGITVQALRRAQVLSLAVDGDTSWGVKIEPGVITLFKGTSFALRDPAFDERFDAGAALAPTGLTEIVFQKFSGLPQTTGTVTFSTAQDSRNVTINEKGTLIF